MPSMRSIKRRKESVQSTQQITKAMKLVATVKLQKARAGVEANAPYFEALYKTMCSILSKTWDQDNRFLKEDAVGRKAILVMSSNRGLAGGYNSNIVKLIDSYGFDKDKVLIYGLGRKGIEGLKRKGYHVEVLMRCIDRLRQMHPNLRIIMEPGSAFLWQTGYLLARVVDVVENSGIKTAILNVSFTCHMPDCLEMPYHPEVRGAETLEMADSDPRVYEECVYRLGGNSCLSGDYMGYWRFSQPLKVGDEIIFEDMIHYTTVKTNMFNGVHHPSLALLGADGTLQILRRFAYEDYESRMG